MGARVRWRSLAWIAALCVVAPPPPVQSGGQGAVAGGELIVKFAAETEARRLAEEAVRGAVSEARLDALAERLSAELDAPLAVRRVTSGAEFLLAVREDVLATRLVERLRARADVLEAKRMEGKAPGDAGAIRAVFRAESAVARELSDAFTEALRASPAIGDLTGELEAGLGVGLTPQPPAALVLTFDVSSLTASLVERLNRRPDVEYAEPQRLFQPLSSGGGQP